jgi:hypothetical protein
MFTRFVVRIQTASHGEKKNTTPTTQNRRLQETSKLVARRYPDPIHQILSSLASITSLSPASSPFPPPLCPPIRNDFHSLPLHHQSLHPAPHNVILCGTRRRVVISATACFISTTVVWARRGGFGGWGEPKGGRGWV